MRRNPLRLYLGLDKDTYILFIARVVNAMGSFVFPFLTLLLVEKLGFTPEKAGIVILVSAAFNVPGSLIGGKLADRVGRKPVIVVAELLVVLLYLPCAFLGPHLAIVPFIILAELALGAVWPALSALLTDRSNRGNRQASFSLIYLGYNLGFAVGLFLAGLLFKRHLPWLFLGNALSTLISMLLVLFLVRERPRPDALAARQVTSDQSPDFDVEDLPFEERPESGNTLQVLLRRRYLLFFVGAIFVLNFVYAEINFALPLQLAQLFPKNGSALYGTLMSVTAVYVVVLTPLVVGLTKRLRPLTNQIAAGLLYAIGFGSVGYLRSYPLFFAAALVWTVGEVLFATNANVYIANHTPRTHRGRVNSILPLIMDSGFALCPPITGRYLSFHAVQSVWPIMFVLAIFAVAGLGGLSLAEHRRTQRTAGRDSGGRPAG